MGYLKRVFCILIIFSLLSTLLSCEKEEVKNIKPQSRVFYEYFDTVGTFSDYNGTSDKTFEALADKVEAMLSEYHKLYDIYNEYEGITNLATLNRTAGEGAQKVDKKIIDMLSFSKEMYALTDGKVNVAMGSVLSIWHDYREKGESIPPSDLLAEASKHMSIESIVISEKDLTVELTDPNTSLDVGAIAKGFAVEMIAKELEKDNLSGYVLDVGGNLRVIGQKPNGNGWKAGIKNPNSPYSQTYVYTLEIKNSALVTSGSYERFYTVDGIRYHHIINSETLMPENYYLSVSVRSPSSAMSDALSTAVFNMKYEEAEKFSKKLDGILFVLVMPDGEVRTLGE